MKMFVPRSCWQQNLTSRSGWVRIIHKVQTFAVTVRKTAGPEPSLVHVHHYSSHLARAESTPWKWHSPYRQPQSQRLHCYLRPMPSMGALTVLVNCRVTVRAYVRGYSGHLFVRNPLVLLAASWTPEQQPDHAGACGGSGGDNKCVTAKVKQEMEELRGEGTTNCTEVKRNINDEGSVTDLTFKQSNGGMQHGTRPPY